MNNRLGIGILGVLLLAAIFYSVIQTQNFNQTQSQLSELKKTTTRQANELVNQSTLSAATLNAAVILGNEKVVVAQTNAEQMALTQLVQAIATEKSKATATLGRRIEQAATVQANVIADSQATLSVVTTQLAESNAQLATLQVMPSPTATLQPTSQDNSSNVQLGTLVTAGGLDRNGCPTQSQSNFAPDQAIYVVAPNSNIPKGTTVFVRLYRDNMPIEDTPEITADHAYTDICVNFVFQPTGADFVSGNYKARFFINGNEGSSIDLRVSK